MKKKTVPTMADFKTIADLGAKASQDYAKGMQELDTSLIKDSFAVSARTEKLSLAPSYIPLELLGEKEKSTWADFPPSIAIPSKYIFGEDLIPGLNAEQIKQTAASVAHLEEHVEKDEDKEKQQKKQKAKTMETETETVTAFSVCIAILQKNLQLSNKERKHFIPG